jgi:hypothetical protein
MPPRVAHALLRAIGPLFALRHDLVDLGMLVLRKAMFQADTNSRLVAVHGLVFFMHWATHTAGSESGTTAPVRDAALSCIRRAFTQQMAVRRALYGTYTLLMVVESVCACVCAGLGWGRTRERGAILPRYRRHSWLV